MYILYELTLNEAYNYRWVDNIAVGEIITWYIWSLWKASHENENSGLT
jgi:hypothetical protein